MAATLSVPSYNPTVSILVKMKAGGSNSAPNTPTNGSNVSQKTFSKITVHNVLSENNGNTLNISNNVNAIVRKIKDFGMCGAVNGAKSGSITSGALNNVIQNQRKRALSECQKSKVETKSPRVKKPKTEKEKVQPNQVKPTKKHLDAVKRIQLQTLNPHDSLAAVGIVVKPPGTPGRKGLPLPQAVARRNARERNRVKQVNNGFAALRQRIPEEVAEAFEAQGNGRGSVKKLSKVETLRMAVEYIRSLEHLLGFEFPPIYGSGTQDIGANNNTSFDQSFTFIKDEFEALSPGMDENFDDSLSHYDVDDFIGTSGQEQLPLISTSPIPNQFDTLPNITTLHGLQYIRIPGTNTYQLLTPDIFAGNSNSPPNSSMEEEQFSNLIDSNCLSPAATTTSDLHSSPPTAITAAPTTSATTTAPVAIAVAVAPVRSSTATAPAGLCSANAVATRSLSPAPVPTSTTTITASMPTTGLSPTAASTSLHQQQQLQTAQPAMLSPATNELLLQTCATTTTSATDSHTQFLQLQLHSRMIKQECTADQTDYGATTTSSPTPAPAQQPPVTTTTLIYQPAATAQAIDHGQRQMLLGHATLSMSPPLDANCNSTGVPLSATLPAVDLQSFYEHNVADNFYEGVVSFKKQLGEVFLDSSAPAAALSDESMIDAIDWWEAHTPKSEGGSVII